MNFYFVQLLKLFVCLLLVISFQATSFHSEPSVLPNTSDQRRLYKGREAVVNEYEIDLLIMIASASGNVRKRNAVRRTTLSRIPFMEYSVLYYFFVTKPDNVTAQTLLSEENATFGDISFADRRYPDFDTSHKVWMELKLASARLYGRPKFLLKCDDDHFIFYEKFFEKLQTLSTTNLIWGRQGNGYGPPGSIYTNNAVLMSMDIVDRVALDERASICGKEDDHCIGTSATRHGAQIVDDHQWMNDDIGEVDRCLCAPWTLESNVIVVHHVHPEVMEAFVDDKELFTKMRYPHRNYA